MCPFNYKGLIVFLFLILIPAVALGEIVTYVDQGGVKHITDLKSDRPLGASPKPDTLIPEAQPKKNEVKNSNKKQLEQDSRSIILRRVRLPLLPRMDLAAVF